MAIVLADLKMFKSATVSDSSSNGGRMSANEVVSGAIANLFPPVEDAERVAGSTTYRKFFQKVNEDGSSTLYSGQSYMERATAGEDVFSIFVGTQTDTQSAITGSERRYAVGDLDVNVSGGATAIDVEVEDGNTGTFVAGDTVRITDKTTLGGSGNTEFRVIDAGGVAVLGNIVTLTLTVALDNAYLASNTRVMAVYEPGNVVASISDFVVTTVGDGDYDDTEITLNNRGSEEDTWTLLWTSSTNFTITGATAGSVGTGTVGGGAAPNNPSWTKPYFTLAAAGFSGTWASGDTIVFKTHPAAIPMWAKRVVPAGAAVAGSNTASVRLRGQVT
jgi:hypothetical protein